MNQIIASFLLCEEEIRESSSAAWGRYWIVRRSHSRWFASHKISLVANTLEEEAEAWMMLAYSGPS
jgi:hypothetical protein